MTNLEYTAVEMAHNRRKRVVTLKSSRKVATTYVRNLETGVESYIRNADFDEHTHELVAPPVISRKATIDPMRTRTMEIDLDRGTLGAMPLQSILELPQCTYVNDHAALKSGNKTRVINALLAAIEASENGVTPSTSGRGTRSRSSKKKTTRKKRTSRKKSSGDGAAPTEES